MAGKPMKVHHTLVKMKDRQSDSENCNSILGWCVNHSTIVKKKLKEKSSKNNYSYNKLLTITWHKEKQIITSITQKRGVKGWSFIGIQT